MLWENVGSHNASQFRNDPRAPGGVRVKARAHDSTTAAASVLKNIPTITTRCTDGSYELPVATAAAAITPVITTTICIMLLLPAAVITAPSLLCSATRSRKGAFAPRSACETTAPAGYEVYFGTLRRGLGLQRSCPALPAATAVKIFLWNLWTTLETGQRTLKTDPGPKVIVSRMSHPFFSPQPQLFHTGSLTTGRRGTWMLRRSGHR